MLKKRNVDAVSGCWIWTGSRSSIAGRPKSHQYGEVRVNYKLMRVHRVTAALHLGFDLSCGLDVCHTCDNPLCFNPKHLFPGTRAENNKDKSNKGRSPYGTKSNRTDLTEDDIREIFRLRNEENMGVRAIARKYGKAHSAISNILQGKRWRYMWTMLSYQRK